eukprot:10026348-Alexandrium_andersonii.AAC.1
MLRFRRIHPRAVDVHIESAPVRARRAAREKARPTSHQGPDHGLPILRLVEAPARPSWADSDVERPRREHPQAWALLCLGNHPGRREHFCESSTRLARGSSCRRQRSR